MLSELRYALRGLAKDRGFTAAATATLALGIGATVAIFGVVDAVLLRPLPYTEPGRLTRLTSFNPEKGVEDAGASYMDFLDWRERGRAFSALAARMNGPVVLGGAGSAERIEAAWVSADMLPMLGIEPVIGRRFLPEEDAPGGDLRVAVLSERAWKSHFAGDRAVLERAVTLDGQPFRVVGVVSDSGPFLTNVGVFLPLTLQAYPNRAGRALDVVGRLAPGRTLESARAEMEAVAGALAREHPETSAGFSIAVRPLHDALVGHRRPALLTLLASVALLLLIACANTASLLLARATARRHELSVRAALGARRMAIAAPLVSESAILAAGSGVLGLLGAGALLGAIRALVGDSLPRIDAARIDGRTAAFAVAVAAGTLLLAGIVPALRAAGRAAGAGLQFSARGGGAPSRATSGLVLVQTALCLLLLSGAALFSASYRRLATTDVGLSPDRVLGFEAAVPAAAYAEPEARRALIGRILERLERIPGVAAAGIVSDVPGQGSMTVSFTAEGHPKRSRAESPQTDIRYVSRGTLTALGIPVLEGRGIAVSDGPGAPPVILVNRRLAARLWPSESALGKRITLFSDGIERRVVGVVGDVKHLDRAAASSDQMYDSYMQDGLDAGIAAVVRTEVDPEALAPVIARAVAEVDPAVAVSAPRPLRERLSENIAEPRLRTMLVTGFAGAALLLAAIGLYGLVAYAVARQRTEIGIRLALGATPGRIRRQFVARALRLTSAGALIGLAAAVPAAQRISSLLFEVPASSPAAFAAAAGILVAVGALAAWLASRRASRVQPIEALQGP